MRCNNVLDLGNGKPTSSSSSTRSSVAPTPAPFLASSSSTSTFPFPPDTRLRIFSGTANPALSQEIACYMGLELGKIKIKRFADVEEWQGTGHYFMSRNRNVSYSPFSSIRN